MCNRAAISHARNREPVPRNISGGKWEAITQRSWPRDTTFKRAADLSDEDVKTAREIGKKAVVGIK